MRPLTALLLLSACNPALDGWWNVTRVSVARDGQQDAKQDAGFALFDEYGDLDLGLSYTFDPVGVTWVPSAEPEVLSFATDWDPTPEGEADLRMWLPVGGDALYLELDVLDHRTASLVLESLPTFDGTVFRFELDR